MARARMKLTFEERPPLSMARDMAKWCRDASKIAAYVNNYFGERLVTRQQCEALIARANKPTGRKIPDWTQEELARGKVAEKPVLIFTPPVFYEPAPKAPEWQSTGISLRPWPQWYRPPTRRKPFAREIVAQVAEMFGRTYDEMVGATKTAYMVDARATAAAVLRRRGMSYPEIARHLQRDHTSVINLLDKLDRYQARNPMIERVLVRLVA